MSSARCSRFRITGTTISDRLIKVIMCMTFFDLIRCQQFIQEQITVVKPSLNSEVIE